jgi:threonylcarbamoyladenosine tRNA methylthiotransferase MtaB
MASFHLLNFGCRASQADGAALKGQLLAHGFEEAEPANQCDVAVLNTCTVTAAADAEVRQVVRRIRRANPRCRILVTGCYAQRAPKEIAALEGVAWVVGNSHKHAVADLLSTEFECSATLPQPPAATPVNAPRIPQPLVQMAGAQGPSAGCTSPTPSTQVPAEAPARVLVGEIADAFHFTPVFADDRTRPTLKVQDGCNARCSFCVIPEVRGGSRSLAPDQVISQVLLLQDSDYREIVLSGINLGGYGRDLNRRITFLGLLERILAETSIPRLRISSIEPMDVTPDLIALVAREPRLARHFHIPLQSGCDRVLRLMNRRYWTDHYAQRVRDIREQIPDCGIGADVMVGFPGETEADHETSLRFIESLPLTYVHVFPYSLRPNTPAASITSQVNGRISHGRGQEVRSVVEKKREEFLAAQVGRTLSVLTLHKQATFHPPPAEAHSTLALTSNYLRVALPGARVPGNTLLDVRVRRVHHGFLYGYPDGPKMPDGSRSYSQLFEADPACGAQTVAG